MIFLQLLKASKITCFLQVVEIFVVPKFNQESTFMTIVQRLFSLADWANCSVGSLSHCQIVAVEILWLGVMPAVGASRIHVEPLLVSDC